MDEQTAGTPRPRPTSRLVVDVVRALRGWVVAAAGGVLLLGCYLGVSKESDVSLQLPYVVSGGFGGLALVLIGSALLVADRFDTAQAAQARTVGQVDDLHSLIIAAAASGAAPEPVQPPVAGTQAPYPPASSYDYEKSATYQQHERYPGADSGSGSANAAGATPGQRA